MFGLLQCSDEGWSEHRMRTGEADRAQESDCVSLQYTPTFPGTALRIAIHPEKISAKSGDRKVTAMLPECLR
jgi:hypothetical protein